MTSEAVTKQDLKRAVDDITDVIGDFAGQVDKRFQSVGKRFDQIEARLDSLENNFHLLIKRIDELVIEMRARDAKIDRLEKWVQQIAKKTGVKLEY